MVPRMRLSCIFCTWFPVRRSEDRVVDKGKVHLVMGGYVFHGMALGEQITNIAKICIIGNLRNSLLMQYHEPPFFYRLGLICLHGWCCKGLIQGEGVFCFSRNQGGGPSIQ